MAIRGRMFVPQNRIACLRWDLKELGSAAARIGWSPVKSLERIADHAENVAEDVVHLCEAQDIRHTGANSGGKASP